MKKHHLQFLQYYSFFWQVAPKMTGQIQTDVAVLFLSIQAYGSDTGITIPAGFTAFVAWGDTGNGMLYVN